MRTKMSILTILMSIAASTTLFKLAMAANYTVGGSTGAWDATTNLQAWAASQIFSVGDNLIFQYTANHNVLEVSKADYDSCQTSNAIQAYSDTDTIITLTSPGSQYFICGAPGHCSIGMKVQIDTLATSATITSAPPPSSSSDDLDNPLIPGSTPTELPLFGPAVSPLSPSNAPAHSPMSGILTSTPFGRSNTFPETSSAGNKGNVKTGTIVAFGLFMTTFLVL